MDHRIETLDGGRYIPFQYPRPGNIPLFSGEALVETERWVDRTLAGSAHLFTYKGAGDLDSKRLYLTWLRIRARDELTGVEQLYESLHGRPIDPLHAGSWQLQQDEGGMFTCQLASAANALNFLYPANPSPCTESDIFRMLGGQQFANANPRGVEAADITRTLQILAPHIRTRRTNSVIEMLRAVENGAAVMFPISNIHEALIPPGHRLGRNESGSLYVQAADPMSTMPRNVLVDSLIRSEITVVDDPERIENNVLILERGIRTV